MKYFFRMKSWLNDISVHSSFPFSLLSLSRIWISLLPKSILSITYLSFLISLNILLLLLFNYLNVLVNYGQSIILELPLHLLHSGLPVVPSLTSAYLIRNHIENKSVNKYYFEVFLVVNDGFRKPSNHSGVHYRKALYQSEPVPINWVLVGEFVVSVQNR